VADFGIAHLAVRQTDKMLARLQLGMRAGLDEFVPMGRVGVEDGIIGLVGALTPAIENAEDNGAWDKVIGNLTIGHGQPYKAMCLIKKRAGRHTSARVVLGFKNDF
jgi:hypothetical protein